MALAAVPEGQGDVPWHRISDSRLTDAMVARVNYSNGNLMLASIDFDIAGVGQKLRMDSTYNSLEAPSGIPASRWMHNYQQHLDITSTEVVLYDHTGASPASRSPAAPTRPRLDTPRTWSRSATATPSPTASPASRSISTPPAS
ncbi:MULTISPECIES: DUF6531 domain-containing protein [Streptomyces]|uniref:DUF6531 domain-containing protein n=1 Tax=Streptomyces TaxID=1883 RepID=UPI0033EAEE17